MARNVSKETVAVEEILSKTNGAATFAAVEDELKARGIVLDSNGFNNRKAAWLKKQQQKGEGSQRKEKVSTEEKPVTDAEALAFVQECGGLKKATAKVARMLALIKHANRLSAMFS